MSPTLRHVLLANGLHQLPAFVDVPRWLFVPELSVPLPHLLDRHHCLRELQHFFDESLLLPKQLSEWLSFDLLQRRFLQLHEVCLALRHLLWRWQPDLCHVFERILAAQRQLLRFVSWWLLQSQWFLPSLHFCFPSFVAGLLLLLLYS